MRERHEGQEEYGMELCVLCASVVGVDGRGEGR